jgi:hypothetical protein
MQKNAVFWDVAPCRYCVNRRFEGTYRLHLQGIRIPQARNQREQVAADWVTSRKLSLQPPAHAGSSLADFFTLKMEAIRSSETSVNTISTRRHIPEDGILNSHRRENLKSKIRRTLISLMTRLSLDTRSVSRAYFMLMGVVVALLIHIMGR